VTAVTGDAADEARAADAAEEAGALAGGVNHLIGARGPWRSSTAVSRGRLAAGTSPFARDCARARARETIGVAGGVPGLELGRGAHPSVKWETRRTAMPAPTHATALAGLVCGYPTGGGLGTRELACRPSADPVMP
jgi:hypothetical protein